ncbi:uncharacterized protein BXZ73DRAFT_51943 [Epithele typhae]|uniref:uncharacterized protein n=1 Tax=Epithele typhae TaxID=378194 RepID=UPI0020086408|nr:uncharacterized protein BXZ73DRAFT_51943 [Epithele typhae]KAH9921207.1 hypothetical protein BXZ73DRAFT_51943 [Epithele typhae]
MATVHLYALRRWSGWYNSPGSYEIAKRYGQLANSRLWDGLFPGPKCEPAALFGLDGKPGPAFLAARSGSNLPSTGHPAYLLARRARDLAPIASVRGRRTTPAAVTLVDLAHVPPTTFHPGKTTGAHGYLALLPIGASVAAAVVCALLADWWCFASIALGIVAGGVASLVIGAGTLEFTHPTPARGAPPGDGVLLDGYATLVVRGPEAAVGALTRGGFRLEYAGAPAFAPIGWCSVLLTAQFLGQLLLVPQGTLFGGLMFVASIVVSWAYNTYLSSIDCEDVQTELLFERVLKIAPGAVRKIELPSRTAMVVFACLALQCDRPVLNPHKILGDLIPNDTPVWQRWKGIVAEKCLAGRTVPFSDTDWKVDGLTEEETELLQMLFEDAEDAQQAWQTLNDTTPRTKST